MLNKIKKLLKSSKPLKQVLIVRMELKMGKGKIASQVAHASVASYLKAKIKDKNIVDRWVFEGMKKIVLKVQTEKELLEYFNLCKSKSIPCELIRDAGKTQINPGSLTTLGIGPWFEDELDEIFNGLKLL